MKIAFISYEYPPHIYGGAGIYAENIVKELSMRGHEVHVFSSVPYVNKPYENVIVHNLGNPKLKIFRILSYWISQYFNFKKIERESGGFDVVIGNGFSELPLNKEKTNAKRILIMHQSAERVIRFVKPSLLTRLKNFNNELGIAPIFDQKLVQRSDMVVVVSNYVKNTLIDDLSIPPSKIEVIYNGCKDTYKELSKEKISSLKEKFGTINRKTLLFVGRLNDKRKGLEELLREFKKVLKKEDVMLLIVGNGIQKQTANFISSLGISDNVCLIGKVPEEELYELYSFCDIYISSSYYESFGLTLVEAMSAKKPIIARSVGGIKEVMTEDNGILYNTDVNYGISKAILGMLDNFEHYKEVGERNREYVMRRFSWSIAAEKIEKIANELIKNKKSDIK